MGRATRWLRGLLGVKKPGSDSNSASASDPYPPKEKKKKKKKRWAFAKSSKEEEKKSKPKPPALAAERGGLDKDMAPHVMVYADEFDQNNAAAVVRLTRSGRRGAVAEREETAAVTIQAAFRGYLARRALRALRSLVKLQALVRGNIVRKQAAETLRRMYALARVQAKARAFRALRSEIERSNSNSSAARQRNWVEQWWRDDEKNAKILEVDPGKPTRGPCFPGSPCSRRSPCFAVCSDHPSYMADTESSKGKLRSYSAPRLRPELEKTSPSKRPSSLHDRFSFQVYYGSGRLDRLGMHA